MAARVMRYVLILKFQILLITARGITLPLNTVTTSIEPFTAQPVLGSSESDNTQNTRNEFVSCESKVLPNFIPVSPITAPNVQNCFNMVLAYAEECALKYGLYNKMTPILYESSWMPQSFTTIPSESYISIADSSKYAPLSGLSLLPKTANSVTTSGPYDLNANNPLDVIKIPTLISPCFDSSITPVTKPSFGFSSPLSLSCTISPTETLQPALDLTKTIELSMSPSTNIATLENSLPCSLFKLNELPNTVIPPLVIPRSTLTLPLSVTNTFTNIKPKFASNSTVLSASLENTPLIPLSSTLSSPQLPLNIYNTDSSLATSLNILPNPSILLPVPDHAVRPALFETTTQKPIVTYSATALSPYLRSAIVNTEVTTHALSSKCPIVPKSALTCRDSFTWLTNVAPAFLETDLSSSPFCNYNTLQPLPAWYVTKLASLSNLPLPNVVSQVESDLLYPGAELNSVYTSPSLPQSSLVFNTLLENPPKTLLAQALGNSHATSSSNNLAFKPTSPSFSLSDLLPTPSSLSCASNYLSLLPSISFQGSSNPFLFSNDIYNSPVFESDSKSFKRSFEQSEREPGILESSEINAISSSPYEPSSDIKDEESSTLTVISHKIDSNESINKILELISIAEFLNNRDISDWNLLNEIAAMIKSELYDIQHSV